jgi:hypothetical protein
MLLETFGLRRGWLWSAVRSFLKSGSCPDVSGTPGRSFLGIYGQGAELGTLWQPDYPHGAGQSTHYPRNNDIMKQQEAVQHVHSQSPVRAYMTRGWLELPSKQLDPAR